MMIVAWTTGLMRTRFGRIAGTVCGIAVTVGLIASLGAFVDGSAQTMTARAIATVPVDWQTEVLPTASPDLISQSMAKATTIDHLEIVGYASVEGFQFKTADSVQATGAGKALGMAASYMTTFPSGFRMLAGNAEGAILLQQTAANLHATPGDTITLHRPGLPDVPVTVSGIVDLKTADTLFQAIGVPKGAAPQAPPDNAVILPLAQWHQLFDPQAVVRPDSVRLQLHAALDHRKLPVDPNAAYLAVAEAGHNLEAQVAGSALLSNNLAATLDAARGDALYARVLFIFLGAPGIVLGALLTLAVARSGGDQRRRDQALLRLRGAPLSTVLQYAAVEAVATGLLGAALGLALAAGSTRLLLDGVNQAAFNLFWPIVAASGGMLLAAVAILIPAWFSARETTVATARRTVGRSVDPLWRRLGVDFVLLGLAALIFWKTAATGYQVVLAPEGVAATSVDYAAFLAPLFLWVGAGLLSLRLADLLLSWGRNLIARALAPLIGPIAQTIATSLWRQRRRVAGGLALTAMAFAFATSTAVFNLTYEGQSRVDAQLTNGADLTATGSSAAPAGTLLDKFRSLPGVAAAEGMQHRYAYVGTDLQDLYGIDPATIGRATTLSSAYFEGGDVAHTLEVLRQTPSAILVSDETVKDFQLTPGDTLNLRLQGPDHQYRVVPFLFAGIAREFPTAPRDSFLVANADYIAKMTGVATREVVLMRISGSLRAAHAAAADAVAAIPGIRITDLSEATHLVGSSLTAVDLAGLTHLELAYAVGILAGASGLVLALGFADRRRSFAILSLLGARQATLGAFIWSEAVFVFIGGLVLGLLTGLCVAAILVAVLQGVFDPPPEQLSLPWFYLIAAICAGSAATTLAIVNAIRQSQIDPLGRLRELS